MSLPTPGACGDRARTAAAFPPRFRGGSPRVLPGRRGGTVSETWALVALPSAAAVHHRPGRTVFSGSADQAGVRRKTRHADGLYSQARRQWGAR
jgi:hypothetical protein